ncbi:AraC family transcriptional regulator [Yimella sp. cx-51]|uniref:helix-turn-helix domain-containing protein n=1 Tax=Yimella sp. cx-51 TaxID=2770551 RepID=UPI00165DF26E|nr:helix-turn-helix transcriptional regulator [Yimella sp. cx-51]MBC9956294.1 helix-turn-helix transcriptional regulator [Yimella sp. cx-51]QTH38569.1 helix-turn-helix transcriptional regulator [Yimella sp. cx-51]
MTAADDIERAHLRDPADRSFAIHRYEPPSHLRGLLRRYWIPVWQVPDGEQSVQKVLQYPICLLITTPHYSRFAGPTRGLSTTVLEGTAWGFGAMFTPAAGALLLGAPVGTVTDRFVELDDVLPGLTAPLRDLMADDPTSEDAHAAGRSLLEARLEDHLPLDEESLLVNQIVELVETDSSIISVTDLCGRVGLAERTLQRLCLRRLGLTPLWLIRRRRLHEASDQLRSGAISLAEVAAMLGYADQAHFSRDFKASTGMTPGEFARMQQR